MQDGPPLEIGGTGAGIEYLPHHRNRPTFKLVSLAKLVKCPPLQSWDFGLVLVKLAQDQQQQGNKGVSTRLRNTYPIRRHILRHNIPEFCCRDLAGGSLGSFLDINALLGLHGDNCFIGVTGGAAVKPRPSAAHVSSPAPTHRLPNAMPHND